MISKGLSGAVALTLKPEDKKEPALPRTGNSGFLACDTAFLSLGEKEFVVFLIDQNQGGTNK